MKELDDNSISLSITSPPYHSVKNYSKNNKDIGNEESYDNYLKRMEKVFKETYRVLKFGRYSIWNISDVLVEGKMYPIAADYIKLLQKVGFKYISDIIWRKPKGMASDMRFGVLIQNPYPMYYLPNLTYEHIIVMLKGNQIIRKQTNKKIDTNKIIKEGWNEAVWDIAPVSATNIGHLAPFPPTIPKRFIELFSYKGETILDMFMGSGTTMRSAINLKRSCVGYELSGKYCELIKKNVNWNQQGIFGKVKWEYIERKDKINEVKSYNPFIKPNVEMKVNVKTTKEFEIKNGRFVFKQKEKVTKPIKAKPIKPKPETTDKIEKYHCECCNTDFEIKNDYFYDERYHRTYIFTHRCPYCNSWDIKIKR